jgi:hypothetical protein
MVQRGKSGYWKKRVIVVDSRLKDYEKIATVFHELVHESGYDFKKGDNPIWRGLMP